MKSWVWLEWVRRQFRDPRKPGELVPALWSWSRTTQWRRWLMDPKLGPWSKIETDEPRWWLDSARLSLLWQHWLLGVRWGPRMEVMGGRFLAIHLGPLWWEFSFGTRRKEHIYGVDVAGYSEER